MKAEDLLKTNPYSYKLSKTQSYLMGLGDIKDYEILHEGSTIRKVTMSESDVSEFVNLLNYAFINGVTQSILRSEKTTKRKSSGLLSTNNSVSGGFGIYYSKGDSNGTSGISTISDSPNPNFNKKDLKKFLVKIDNTYYLSIGDLLRLGFSIPSKGTSIKVQEPPYTGYTNRRIYINELTFGDSIWTSPFATEIGKRPDSIEYSYVALNTINFLQVEFKLHEPITNSKDSNVNFSMGF